MKKLFQKAARWLLWIARRTLGGTLVDLRTGKKVKGVIVFPWKGRLRVVGLDGEALKVRFSPQERETYWCQDLEFSSHEPPDFLNVRDSDHSHFTRGSGGGGEDVPDVAGGPSGGPGAAGLRGEGGNV